MANIPVGTLPYPLRSFDLHGKKWEYICAGKGKTLVMLPGGGETAESNFLLVRALEKTNQVIVVTVYDVDSIDEFAAVLNAILQREHVQSMTLYGLSIGGMLAQVYTRCHPEKVTALILSHTCSPVSKTYRLKVILPLRFANMLLLVVTDGFLRYCRRFAGAIQGYDKSIESKYSLHLTAQDRVIMDTVMRDYYERFFNKRLIRTWINIHFDFIRQRFHYDDFSYLGDRILILRTDNDPLVQDEGDFVRLYPQAEVHTLHDTGHLSTYYQRDTILASMKKFLGK